MAKKARSRGDRAVPAGDGSDRAATGIEGLDDILGGGFARGRLHLVQGAPGAGKTTLALQFLLAGAARGESGLLISLSETEDELSASASSHGWSLDSIHVHDVSALEQLASLDFQQSVFQPAEIELTETTQKLLAPSSRSSRRGWYSIRSPSCALWPAIRCGTGARSSRLSRRSRATAAQCC